MLIGCELSTSDTHRSIFAIGSPMVFRHGTVNFGNNSVGARSDCVGVCNTLMDVRDNHIRVDRKFGL